MDFKSKIDIFYKDFDQDYNDNIINGRRVEEIGVSSLEDYKKYYEDMIEALKNIVISINKHIKLYDKKEVEEYSKKAKVLIGKAFNIIENFDNVIKIKRQIINNKLNDLDNEKDKIEILNKGGTYKDFLSDYIITKNKMDFTDEVKENKEKIFKEINSTQKEAKENKNSDEIDDIIAQVKSGNFWGSSVNTNSKTTSTPPIPKPTSTTTSKAGWYKPNNKVVPSVDPGWYKTNTTVAPSPTPNPNPTPAPKPSPTPNPNPTPNPSSVVNNTTASKPKVVKKVFPMSLNDLIANGKLPDNIEEADLLNICQSLGINATDMDYEIDEILFSRLDNDDDIKQARFNIQLKNKHNERIEEYERLIKNYEDILGDRKYNKQFYKEYWDNLQEIVNRLHKEKQEYEDLIEQMVFDDVSSYFRFNIGNPNEALDANAGAKAANIELRNEYKKLDRERIALNSATTKKMKSIIGTRIGEIEKNIQRLKKKESEFSSRQIRIINENSGRYISKIRSRQANYNESQEKILKDTFEVHNIKNEMDRFSDKLKDIDNDLSTFVANSRKERRQLREFERDKRYLEDMIRRLSSKRGEVDLKAQHHQEVLLKNMPR